MKYLINVGLDVNCAKGQEYVFQTAIGVFSVAGVSVHCRRRRTVPPETRAGGGAGFMCGYGHYPAAPGDHPVGGVSLLQLRDAGGGGIQQHVDRETHGHNGQRGNGCRHLAVHYSQENIHHGLCPVAYRPVALGQSAVYPDEHGHNRCLGAGLHVQHHSGLGEDGAFHIVRPGIRGNYLCRAPRDGMLYKLVSGAYSPRKKSVKPALYSARLKF